MKIKKPKNKTSQIPLKIGEFEFEGLSSFEEINSYKILKEVKRDGKKNFEILKIKNPGKKTKGERTDETLNITENEKTDKTPNITKLKDAISKRKRDENEESSYKKAKYDTININAWKSIFVPDIILEAISELEFKEPTTIQKLTIPPAIEGRKDIIGAAETGSGKTLAFMIPIINGILRDREKEAQDSGSSDNECEEVNDSENDDGEELVQEEEEESEVEIDEEELGMEEEDDDLNMEEEEEEIEEGVNYKGNRNIGCVKVINNANFDFMGIKDDKTNTNNTNKLRALVITPTRELAVQIRNHTEAILTKTDIKTALVIGGLSYEKQERILNKKPEIVIGTPGRLWEMIQSGNKHLSFLNSIRYLAIDETDRMLEKGHFEELQHILEQINCYSELQSKRQNFIFSATLTLIHKAPKRLKQKKKVEEVTTEMKLENFMKLIGVRTKPKIIDITRKFGTAESLSETKVFCEKNEKDLYLYYFLKRFPGRTLVFCNSINCVRRLNNLLTILRCHPQSLYAGKQQKQRLKNLDRFKSNNFSVLLATDVAERGLDIPGIKHVIHYEVPKTAETYIHRSGRTARANQEGLSVLLISSEEVVKYRQLCTTLNRSSHLQSFPIDHDLLANIRNRVSLAKEIETLKHRENRKKNDDKWFKEMIEEAELEVDQSSEDEDDIAITALQKKKEDSELQNKLSMLSQLLSTPVISSAFSGRYPTITGKLLLPNRSVCQENTDGALELVKHGKKNINIFPKSNKSKSKKNKRKKVKDKKNKEKS